MAFIAELRSGPGPVGHPVSAGSLLCRPATAAGTAFPPSRGAGSGGAAAAGPLPPRGSADGGLPVDLRRALDLGMIEPFFQPQCLLGSGEVLGFEALARLRLPSGQVLPPARFIGAASRMGLIHRIDETVLSRALDALATWRRAGFAVPRVSVNVSAPALRDPGYLDRMRMHLDARDLAPRDLAIEIVESTLIEDDDDAAVRHVCAFARAGIAVELDDFGSGHAAVSNLLRLELKAIKLDRSIIRGLGGDGRSEKILRALLSLAEELDLLTIAEGAETDEDLACLRSLGCWAVQGYALARPMPAAAVLAWLADAAPALAAPSAASVGALRLSA